MLPSNRENLSCCSTKLIHICKTTTCIGYWAEQIFSVNIYTYFSILGVAFVVLFMLFPKAPASSCKKILN